jgi:hypothetical protein
MIFLSLTTPPFVMSMVYRIRTSELAAAIHVVIRQRLGVRGTTLSSVYPIFWLGLLPHISMPTAQ